MVYDEHSEEDDMSLEADSSDDVAVAVADPEVEDPLAVNNAPESDPAYDKDLSKVLMSEEELAAETKKTISEAKIREPLTWKDWIDEGSI